MRRNAKAKAIDVQPYLDDLRRYLEDLDGLVAAWIYGSDPNLALLFQKDRIPDLDLYAKISKILHREDVPIPILNRAPIRLQFRVIAEGRKLVCRDPVALADFVEWVICRHSNFEVYSQKLAEEFGPTIVEQYQYEI